MPNKITAYDVWVDQVLHGDAPSSSAELDKFFPDTDPELVDAILRWHVAKKIFEDAIKELERLAIADGWVDEDIDNHKDGQS